MLPMGNIVLLAYGENQFHICYVSHLLRFTFATLPICYASHLLHFTLSHDN